MGKEIIVDEYGCEITKEEAEEMDKIAHKALDAAYGEPKKKPGRPKKSESGAKLHENKDSEPQNLRTAAVSSKELHPAAAVR